MKELKARHSVVKSLSSYNPGVFPKVVMHHLAMMDNVLCVFLLSVPQLLMYLIFVGIGSLVDALLLHFSHCF